MPNPVLDLRQGRVLALAVFGLLAAPVDAQMPSAAQSAGPTVASEVGAPAYADLVDLALASPVIADATIRSVARIKRAEAVGVRPGFARFYVEADLGSLVRAPGALPPRIGYLLDTPLDARGRPPKLKKQRVLLFARPVSGSAGQLQLAAPDAQLPWTAAAEARTRRIARELADADAPPAITGLGNAFHVPGALPGEGETQVFLQTADARPVSITVLSRPGEARRWAVALSEIVDEAAGPPVRDTLLWYRLACGLPRDLPSASIAQLGPEDAARAQADYRYVLQQLGPCGRTRPTT